MQTIITNVEALKMPKLKIKRWYHDDCTLGRLTYGDLQCFTLELPWLDNQQNISCIPAAGAYQGRKHKSPSNGDCIAIDNVLGRSHIQIHKGNYTRNVKGCILVGDSVRFLDGDSIPDVTNSTATLRKLLKVLPSKFLIEIE